MGDSHCVLVLAQPCLTVYASHKSEVLLLLQGSRQQRVAACICYTTCICAWQFLVKQSSLCKTLASDEVSLKLTQNARLCKRPKPS